MADAILCIQMGSNAVAHFVPTHAYTKTNKDQSNAKESFVVDINKNVTDDYYCGLWTQFFIIRLGQVQNTNARITSETNKKSDRRFSFTHNVISTILWRSAVARIYWNPYLFCRLRYCRSIFTHIFNNVLRK